MNEPGDGGTPKVRLQDVPPALMIAAARALAEDEHVGRKPYDWRGTRTSVMRHVGGILRHLMAYVDGEDIDPISPTGKRHLDGVAGRLAILLDAVYAGDVTDDRPARGPAAEALRRPGTVREFMERARAAGQDVLGIANDPEALACLDAIRIRANLGGTPEVQAIVEEATARAAELPARSVADPWPDSEQKISSMIAPRHAPGCPIALSNDTRRQCTCGAAMRRCTRCDSTVEEARLGPCTSPSGGHSIPPVY